VASVIEMFRPELPIWEVALRGTVGWLALVVLVRIVPKRNAGAISPNDMLVLVVIGSFTADAIMAGSTSAGDLFSMTLVVLLWGYVLDALELRFPALRPLMRHRTTPLIENGRMLRRNMRREMVTEEELMATLRKQGIAGPSEVARACLEADGEISVLKR
jgi:uncharacterized membrane protein YcaP (DUF421 family)